MQDFNSVEQMRQQILQQEPVTPMVTKEEFCAMSTLPEYKQIPEVIKTHPSTFHQALTHTESKLVTCIHNPSVQIPLNKVRPKNTKNQCSMKSTYNYLFD